MYLYQPRITPITRIGRNGRNPRLILTYRELWTYRDEHNKLRIEIRLQPGQPAVDCRRSWEAIREPRGPEPRAEPPLLAPGAGSHAPLPAGPPAVGGSPPGAG